MPLAWIWYGGCQAEAQADQPRALAAGTTMAGFAETVGGIPLLLAHVVGLGILAFFGWRGWRWQGMAFGILAVGVTSLFGIVLGQLAWGGELFKLGIDYDPATP